MFDIGFSEWIFMGCVALVLIAPKDFPRLARYIGQLYRKSQILYYRITNNLALYDDEPSHHTTNKGE